MILTEGVDYSTTPPGAAALRAAGKRFVCRYLARDSRGITRAEVDDLTAHGIDIVANYESTADRMLGGFSAGSWDAEYANSILVSLGLPGNMPIYFSCDFDATPDQQPVIDDYLRGVASIIGPARVGVYGGYHVVKRCDQNGTAKWFWQTTAWSGGNVWPHIHLWQYAYGVVINGTVCDLDRASQDNYGQASKFRDAGPIPFPEKRIKAPDKMSAQGHHLSRNAHERFLCIQGGRFKTAPSRDAPNATDTPYRANRTYTFGYRTTLPDGEVWLVSKEGSWAPHANFAPNTS